MKTIVYFLLISILCIEHNSKLNAQTYNSMETNPLGSNQNSFQLLNERGGIVGLNYIFNRLWSLRDVTGSDWYSARLHDGISVDVSFKTPSVDTKTWWERDPNHNIQSWGNDNQTYFTINSGQIGIGTTNPSSKLEVVGGDSKFDNNYNLYIPSTGSSYFWKGADGVDNVRLSVWDKFTFYNPTTAGLNTNNSNWNVQIGARDGSIITRGSSYFAITSGNVGVGTISPAYKLDVIGTIRAREIKVDLNGADFVFENNYKLMPISELETFVKEQKHLPEIVPAKEMKENGTDLGDLNSKLLQKMEEMTLYMIEQNKKIEQQNERIKSLEEKIAKTKSAQME
jgi:hypothetical protein